MRWHKGTTLRILTVHAALFSVLLIVLLSAIFFRATAELEEQLRDRIAGETARFEQIYHTKGIAALRDEIRRDMSSSKVFGLYFVLRDAAGAPVVSNIPDVPFHEGWGREEFFQDPDDATGQEKIPFITWGLRLGKDGTLMLAANYELADDLREIIYKAAFWVLILTLVLAVGTGFLILRANLRRIRVISESSREMMDGDFSRRIPLSGADDEYDHLSENINALLGRIEALLSAMRRVTNDIAHDLRTPLARLRQKIERAREEEVTTEALHAVLDAATGEIDRIIETFNALLSIGQIEAGKSPGQFASVDFSAVVTQIFETYQAVTDHNGQTLTAEVAADIHVRGDQRLLTQMLANLVENAINHCPEATRIRLSLSERSERAVFVIADDGPGIPEAEREKIFRPFYRLEKSRTGTGTGTGLGLALVAAIASLHGIDIHVSDNRPGTKTELALAAIDRSAAAVA